MKMAGEITVITGASGGIGLALAQELDREGMRLVLVAKSEDHLKETIKQLSGKEHAYFTCNLANPEAVKKLVQEIKTKYDQIDILVNGAGIGVYKPIEGVTFEDWKNSFSIGVDAPYFLTQVLLPFLARS